MPLQRGVWQGGVLCRPEMSEGKRGWTCLVFFVGVQVRFASWGANDNLMESNDNREARIGSYLRR